MHNLGNRIKTVILESGLTMSEVASKSRIPNSTLSEIVTGKYKNLSIQKAIAICEVVECSLDYLIEGTSESPNNNPKHTSTIDNKKNAPTRDALMRLLTSNERMLLKCFNNLNEAGQNRLLEYGADLEDVSKYLKKADDSVEISADLA